MRPERVQPGPGQESVWDYPRPPRMEACSRQIVVIAAGVQIARTTRSFRVLETSHPPVYYLPRQDILAGTLWPCDATSFCEWKGMAHYFHIRAGGREFHQAAWSYPAPRHDYEALRNFVALYPQLMDACYVDGQRVTPQPGSFYGGWITSDIVGPYKGEPGTAGW